MGQLDLALIGNCQISALLDKRAAYVWASLPRFDSPSVFASMLGGDEAGEWSILPVGEYETAQRYLRNTNVVQTEFHLKNGDRYDVIDFCPRFPEMLGYHRPAQFMRILRAVRGNPRVRVSLRPRLHYGQVTPQISTVENGILYRDDWTRLYLQSDIPHTYILNEQPFELTGSRYMVLTYGEPFTRPIAFACEEFYDRTVSYWRTWVKHCNIPFEYQSEVIRSALALKLHIFEDTGAIIAATTTSLPESEDGGRTWDYRYCWLRDSYFVINALNQLGQFEEMERFVQYLHNIAVTEPAGSLQPVYGIGGERELNERVLPWLKGFKGIGPVRVGNAAYTHSQHDVYGEMVLAVMPLFFDARFERIDLQRAFENVRVLVEQSIRVFSNPDSGIWEFRREPRHFVFSKLLCWAAVDRGIKIATKMGRMNVLEHWIRAETMMRQELELRGWNEEAGYYVQSYDEVAPDASNLLMYPLGFVKAENPRFKRMIAKYEELLVRKGYVFRYREADDFGVPRHAFTICTFWLVDALIGTGRKEEARRIFEGVLATVNHVGLLSEDVDPDSGELWGNFPQTYSHVGVIHSAFRVSKPWNEAF